MSNVIEARGLTKRYGRTTAVDNIDIEIPAGRIVGLIGPNGAGKTSALKAILGLTTFEGDLKVLGKNPSHDRAALMEDVCFIADVAVLPRWIRVWQLIEFTEKIHPKFSREKCIEYLKPTKVTLDHRVKQLSKGMVAQLHLAIVMAIDAKLLVLDEPTLGLDIIYRQNFYDAVLNDYFHDQRSILVTTHEVREIEHILTDVVFIHRGRARLAVATAEIPERFVKLTAGENVTLPEEPLSQRKTLAGIEYIFADVARDALAPLGELSTPNVPELFVAVVEHEHD